MELVLDLIMLIGAITGLGGAAWIYLDSRKLDSADVEHASPQTEHQQS